MQTILLVEDNEPSRDALSRRHREKSLAAGADGFDAKPVRFEQLLEKIGNLLPTAELVQ